MTIFAPPPAPVSTTGPVWNPAHPLWMAGFRSFFLLACLAGLSLPLLWAAMFASWLVFPAAPFSVVQWHAHEMFFGFGWAVLGGFLLTASKNWVGIRGYHGLPLLLLAAAWLFERAGMVFAGVWPLWLFKLSNHLFLIAIVVMLLATLIRHRKQDSFRDNFLFILALPLFPVAKELLLTPDYFQAGWAMSIGLFRLAFLIMLERTLSPFMAGAFRVSILRHAGLDMSIKLLALLMVFDTFLPASVGSGASLLLACLLAIRFAFWSPHLALRRLDIGVMYLGYVAIVAQLLLVFLDRLVQPAWIGALAVHVFTFGAMGLIPPAMLIRISKGHTGRKVVFDAADKLALWLMVLAFIARVLAPQLLPDGYLGWIVLAAACWFATFAILAWRLLPMLVAPRIDGREH